jgi:hypothetical protein
LRNVKRPVGQRSTGPSFLFIGAAKAGSSWFFELLREHPAVFVPPNRGTYFFSRLYGMGFDWYERFFPSDARGRVMGEVCHDYLVSPEALQRIRDYRPDMRLVCCLRNPYERAISAWQVHGRNGIALPTLTEHAESNPGVFSEGYYGTQLANVRALFPEEQVLVFLYQELLSNPAAVVRRLYEFIGVDGDFSPRSLHVRANPNGSPRSRVVARLVHNIHMLSWGRSRTASNIVGWIKQIRPLRRLVTGALYVERTQPNNWRDFLGEFPSHVVVRYEQELSILETLLGRSLACWRAPPGISRLSRPQEADTSAPSLLPPGAPTEAMAQDEP